MIAGLLLLVAFQETDEDRFKLFNECQPVLLDSPVDGLRALGLFVRALVRGRRPSPGRAATGLNEV